MSRAGTTLPTSRISASRSSDEAEPVDLVVGVDDLLSDREIAELERAQRVAQAVADEMRDLDEPLFQEAGLDLCQASSRTGRRRTRP